MLNFNDLESVMRFEHLHTREFMPYVLAKDYLTLKKLAKRLSTIDTHCCNGTRYTDDASYEIAVNKVYAQLGEMLDAYGISWYHQRDPRGASLYLSREVLTQENYSHALCIV